MRTPLNTQTRNCRVIYSLSSLPSFQTSPLSFVFLSSVFILLLFLIVYLLYNIVLGWPKSLFRSFHNVLPSMLLFSHLVTSDSLRPHGLQPTRIPCPLPSPGACSNSRPLSWWCHPTVVSSVIPFSSCPQSFPASGSFQMSQLYIRWPKYWSFSFNISPSNEYLGLISFRIDWFDLLVCYRCAIQWLTVSKGYTQFIVIIKYWLYSPCYTIFFIF